MNMGNIILLQNFDRPIGFHRRRKRGEAWGTCPEDFAINKEVPFYFRKFPCYLKEGVPSKRRAPKFDMLPTSLLVPELLISFWRG